jgi:hypothetical protein
MAKPVAPPGYRFRQYPVCRVCPCLDLKPITELLMMNEALLSQLSSLWPACLSKPWTAFFLLAGFLITTGVHAASFAPARDTRLVLPDRRR